jgi:hypothetical protein
MIVPRWTAYVWAAPTTLVGLAGAVLADHIDLVDGVLEGYGPQIGRAFDLVAPRRSIMAMTLGHVVLARSRAGLDDTRAHERVHVRQCERWGPLFVPAYVVASLCARLRGGDAYFDNRFEREAWRAAPLGVPASAHDAARGIRRRADAT